MEMAGWRWEGKWWGKAACEIWFSQGAIEKTIIKFYWKQKAISVFALYPSTSFSGMQYYKMNSCNVRSLLCKIGSSVATLQVGCKILVVVLQVGWESLHVHTIPLPVFFLSSLIFFYSFPAQLTVVACMIFPYNVLYFLIIIIIIKRHFFKCKKVTYSQTEPCILTDVLLLFLFFLFYLLQFPYSFLKLIFWIFTYAVRKKKKTKNPQDFINLPECTFLLEYKPWQCALLPFNTMWKLGEIQSS